MSMKQFERNFDHDLLIEQFFGRGDDSYADRYEWSCETPFQRPKTVEPITF